MSDLSRALAEAVVEVFDRRLRLPAPEGDRFEAEGRAAMVAQLQPFIAAGRPLPFLLPGFAFKNPDPAKTLGALPDLAEQLAVERLGAFCEAVEGVYQPAGEGPAVALTLLSGGLVWGRPLNVSDEVALAYELALREMTEAARGVEVLNLAELWGVSRVEALTRVQSWRQRLDLEGVVRRMEAPDGGDERWVLKRFTRLISETPERLAKHAGAPVEQLGLLGMGHRAHFTALLAERFPEHVRLSVHISDNRGPKYAVSLVEDCVPGTPPYHGVIVLDGERQRLMPRAEAEAFDGGVEVVERGGQPWCLRRRSGA